METESSDIMNEVDELLRKLDNLPDGVRLQALKRLSQKIVKNVSHKTNVEDDSPDQEKQVQGPTLGVNQEASGVTKEKRPLSVENKKNVKRKVKPPTEGVILSGRRQTKKVDYRQLAEYGLEDKVSEQESEPVRKQPDSVPVKRGRGRPRKHPVGIQVPLTGSEEELMPIVSSVSISNNEESITTPGLNSDSGEKNGVSSKRQYDALDLLESCLKESGIKAVEAERHVKRLIEDDEKDEESTKRPFEIIKVEEEIKVEDEDEEMKPKEEIFICDSVESIDNVPKRKTVKASHKCDICGKMYSTQSILKAHQVRHRKKEDLPYGCEKCDFKAASKIELFRHTYRHTNKQMYICEICGSTFSRDTCLREHIEYVHTKSNKLKCAQCEFVTCRRASMRKHLLSHQGTRPVIACPVCGVTFKLKSNLKSHLLSHTRAKPFSCDECGKKFTMRNRLVAHKIQVHEPRQFACHHCSKRFPTVHHLQRHVRIHTGEKPYMCCYCVFSCNTQGNLIKHIRHLHDKINFTYKDFLRESGKEKHIQKVDDVEYAKITKVGEELAQRLLPTLEELTGQELTVDQLKEQVQREKNLKVAAQQDQQMRRKRRALRKALTTSKSSYFSDTQGKITLYSVPGLEESSPVEGAIEEQLAVENGLGSFGDNQCWLTHTDENGCVMLIPWDPAFLGDSEEGEEEGEWARGFKGSSGSGASIVAVKATGEEEEEDEEQSELKLSSVVSEAKRVGGSDLPLVKSVDKSLADIHGSGDIVLGEMVGRLDPMDVKITIGGRGGGGGSRSRSGGGGGGGRKQAKQLPESIQVIASNEPVDDSVPSASNFVLPEGYIVDDDGQVLQLTDNVLDTNLVLRPVPQVVGGTGGGGAGAGGREGREGGGGGGTGGAGGGGGGAEHEVTINKISSNVYSLMSQGSDGEEGETFVITTQEGEEEDEEEEEEEEGGRKCLSPGGRVDLLAAEDDDEERHSALVLIVNAEELEST